MSKYRDFCYRDFCYYLMAQRKLNYDLVLEKFGLVESLYIAKIIKNKNFENFLHFKKTIGCIGLNKFKEDSTIRKRKKSGFNEPAHISTELSIFLHLPSDTLMPRTRATKMIHLYVKAHNLQNPRDGRIINCDATLQALLRVPENITLFYFNLQTYLSSHFIKNGKGCGKGCGKDCGKDGCFKQNYLKKEEYEKYLPKCICSNCKNVIQILDLMLDKNELHLVSNILSYL